MSPIWLTVRVLFNLDGPFPEKNVSRFCKFGGSVSKHLCSVFLGFSRDSKKKFDGCQHRLSQAVSETYCKSSVAILLRFSVTEVKRYPTVFRVIPRVMRSVRQKSIASLQ